MVASKIWKSWKREKSHKQRNPLWFMNDIRLNKGNRIERGFSMGRKAGKYINVEIFDSHQAVDLTQMTNLVVLVFSIILCFLLFLAK